MYIVTQSTINKDMEEITKYHPYHNLSYSPHGLKNKSINVRHITLEMYSI